MTRPPKDSDPPKKAFELLALAAAFAQRDGLSLNDPTLVERFFADAAPRLKAALADPTLLHGTRTERMFEATVLSLGRFRLLKTEDIGRVHAATTYRAPDFRIVLDEGDQWLVEVKNVRCENPQNTCYADLGIRHIMQSCGLCRADLWSSPLSNAKPRDPLGIIMVPSVATTRRDQHDIQPTPLTLATPPCC